MYYVLKNMKPAERKKANRRVVFFAGKAAPACKFNQDLYQ
jgi:starch phosphorylase